MFEKVLIANRGEIAVRVIRTLKEMGIGAVAVYSEADRDARHVREADEAYLLGPAVPAESYLNIEKILEVAAESGSSAIHPGYGFLAENAPFARAIGETDITWIGPPADAIDAMGSKTRAREIMQAAGVPIVPGATEPSETAADAKKLADEIGFPIACKAAGGGGGKGFRVALTPDELESAFEGAAREGEKFFGDATVYLERYLEDPDVPVADPQTRPGSQGTVERAAEPVERHAQPSDSRDHRGRRAHRGLQRLQNARSAAPAIIPVARGAVAAVQPGRPRSSRVRSMPASCCVSPSSSFRAWIASRTSVFSSLIILPITGRSWGATCFMLRESAVTSPLRPRYLMRSASTSRPSVAAAMSASNWVLSCWISSFISFLSDCHIKK